MEDINRRVTDVRTRLQAKELVIDQNLDSRLRIYRDSSLIAAVYWFKINSFFRRRAFPTHTEIPEIPNSDGGIAESQLLLNYFDDWFGSRFAEIPEDLGQLANQFQSVSERQAVIYNEILALAISSVEVPESARCEFLTGLFEPVAIAADTIMYTNPKTFQWLEQNRRQMISCLPGSKLATLGLWFYDWQTGAMDQFPACEQEPGTAAPSCQWGFDFIWSISKKNMGMGDCTLNALAKTEPVPGLGFLCDNAICRAAEAVAAASRRGRAAIPEDTPQETPFELDINAVREEICNKRGANPRVPPMTPPCSNVLPGYVPQNNSLFDCLGAGAGESFAGIKNGPACQVSEGAPKTGTYDCGTVGNSDCTLDVSGSGGEPSSGNEEEEHTETNRETSDRGEVNVADCSHPGNCSAPAEGEIGGAQDFLNRNDTRTQLRIAASILGFRQPDANVFGVVSAVISKTIRLSSAESMRVCGQTRGCISWRISANPLSPQAEDFQLYLGPDAEWLPSDPGYPRDHVGIFGLAFAAAKTVVFIVAEQTLGALMGPDISQQDSLDLLTETMNILFVGEATLMTGLRREVNGRIQRMYPSGLFRTRRSHLCGEDNCSGSCTPGTERLTRVMQCVRGQNQPPPPGAYPEDCRRDPRPDACGPSMSGDNVANVPEPQNLSGCFDQTLLGMANCPGCAAVDCGENGYPTCGPGGTCHCATPGSGGGGGPVGPLDCDDLGPRNPRCPRGGEGPGGPGRGGFNPRGGPGAGARPVIPGGGNNPAER